MSEIEQELAELEKRVSELKNWKRLYEDEKASREKDKTHWQKEREGYIAQLGARQTIRDALLRFLDIDQGMLTVSPRTGSEAMTLVEKELSVDLCHEEKTVNMTTGTVNGKILFCALTEMPKDGFSEAQLGSTLREHGWNVGHSTLAPNLGGLVRDGYLIKLDGKPAKYRLPVKVKLNVVESREGRYGGFHLPAEAGSLPAAT